MKKLKKKYNLLLENCQEIILFFNKEGMIIDCNRAARDVLGYENDEIYNVSIIKIFKKAVSFKNGNLIINPKFYDRFYETIAYKRNQTCFSVDLKIIYREDDKNTIGLCIASDITEKKKYLSIIRHLKHDIKSLKQIKNKFVANITHELKTPVNGIMGMTEALLDMKLTQEQKENVNIIYQCCKNMNTMINDLLDVVKMKNNRLVLEQRVFHFRLMIDNIIKLNIKGANEKQLKLIVNVSKDIPEYLIGDEYRLAQIINNLLSNAIKFTNVGQIVLEVAVTERIGDQIELFFMVIDTGIGINSKEKDKLFMSFYQVDGSITRRFGGAGLGLSICKMLVKAMGGNISVESEKDKGSNFSFTVRLKAWKGDPYLRVHTEYDYIDILLNDTATQSKKVKVDDYRSKITSFQEFFNFHMEKLLVCIEMGNWECAEKLAIMLRDVVSKDDKLISKKILQLLFTIRKEDRSLSLKRAKELERMLSEVN